MPSVYFGGASTSQPIHVRNVMCSGNEDRLRDCSSEDGSTCSHDMDVGIICEILQRKLEWNCLGIISFFH